MLLNNLHTDDNNQGLQK